MPALKRALALNKRAPVRRGLVTVGKDRAVRLLLDPPARPDPDTAWDRLWLVSVRKHFESFESLVIQSGDLIREGHHRCGRRRTADVTTAANCDIRVT